MNTEIWRCTACLRYMDNEDMVKEVHVDRCRCHTCPVCHQLMQLGTKGMVIKLLRAWMQEILNIKTQKGESTWKIVNQGPTARTYRLTFVTPRGRNFTADVVDRGDIAWHIGANPDVHWSPARDQKITEELELLASLDAGIPTY